MNWARHGVSRSEIARRRGTTVDAVKYHLANISDKLGVRGGQVRHWPGIPATSRLVNGRNSARMTDSTRTVLGTIGQVSLFVRDIERAERFYGQTLGLPHLFTFGDLAFFDAGGVRLYLHRKDAEEWKPASVLYFTVDDIHAAQASLAAGGVAFSGAPHTIHTHDDGTEEWMTFFDDGEGNTLALMSAVAPGR